MASLADWLAAMFFARKGCRPRAAWVGVGQRPPFFCHATYRPIGAPADPRRHGGQRSGHAYGRVAQTPVACRCQHRRQACNTLGLNDIPMALPRTALATHHHPMHAGMPGPGIARLYNFFRPWPRRVSPPCAGLVYWVPLAKGPGHAGGNACLAPKITNPTNTNIPWTADIHHPFSRAARPTPLP